MWALGALRRKRKERKRRRSEEVRDMYFCGIQRKRE
jgi:hypothetical protein